MVGKPEVRPSLLVLAGANGAGKSSVGGAAIRQSGADYFNPDEAARRIRAANPGVAPGEANSAAWHEGKRLLERAIRERLDYAFETTLGGNTIPGLIERAADSGLAVRVWFVGLEGPDLHVERVRSRVAAGGHDIPEGRIRERYDCSRINLIRLLPTLTELRLHDNSEEGDPVRGAAPRPLLILHRTGRGIVDGCDLRDVPGWAKPIVAAAIGDANRAAGELGELSGPAA